MGGKGSGGGGQDLKAFFQSGGKTGGPAQSARPEARGKYGPSGASDNDRQGGSYSAGGGKKRSGGDGKFTNWGEVAKAGGKWGAGGAALGGAPGSVFGAGYGAGREIARQWGEQNLGSRPGVPNISVTQSKRMGGRASMPGRPAGSELYQFSKFNPTDLLTGRRQDTYQGPTRAGSSILGSDNETDDSLGDTGTYDEYGGR